MMTAENEKYRKELLEEGRELGIHQTKVENAINLLKRGSEVSFVSEAIGLSIEEVEKLQREI